ncbi:ATPase ASNA1 -like protein [Babesia sp. Xinjiang]|uniref:ATPase ASNA1 -like protein n=1 Tax=Babesia sp. Xinjiang TaxID=462227 RepID=UPI000A241372|nr:ATPase ASNA1 -like protein [Babesia sp. Xinjiang]ORM41216.1 ATPase ASNA1 -like protein [Babesia sp. Xinjiang]
MVQITEIIEPDGLLRNDIQNLVKQTTLQWIFVGGKGGVGKTTISSSIATALAETRESVLLLSTDPAHSLSDAFGQKFSHEPRLVNGFNNLYAMELNTSQIVEGLDGLRETHSFLQNIPDILMMLPGLDEALSFVELMQSVQSRRFSVTVFDTAPTGHTLKFLKLPEVLDKIVDTLLKLEATMGSLLQLLSSMTKAQMSQTELFDKIKLLGKMINTTHEQMKDPNLTTFVCVCIPEFLSVYETERLIQDLARSEIDCSYIIVNQVLKHIEIGSLIDDAWNGLTDEQREIMTPFFEKVREHHSIHNSRVGVQRKYLQDIKDLYQEDFNIVAIHQNKQEVRGKEALMAFAKSLMQHNPLPF